MASSFLCVKFVLCVIWASGFHAAQNVDYLEPLVKISPAVDIDELDGFGWTAVLHQVDEVLSSDSMSEALAKTRSVNHTNYPMGESRFQHSSGNFQTLLSSFVFPWRWWICSTCVTFLCSTLQVQVLCFSRGY